MEAVVKPDRYPDHVTPYGSAYWWVEMIYVGANGVIARISLNEDTGKFHMVDERTGERGTSFNEEIKRFYDAWWYETFESKFMGNSTDEDCTAEVK
jgi:hypothetical protein